METIRTHAAEIDIVPNKSYFLTCNAFPHEFEILDLDGFERYGSFLWLEGDTPENRLKLQLTPLKPPEAHGQDGYSHKGSSPQNASCYYSFTRLATEGRIRIYDKTIHVQGLSWMDHEYSTALLEPGIVGWDCFSLQLSDHRGYLLGGQY